MTATRPAGVAARPAAEASLFAVHLAVALGFARLYVGDEHAPPLLATVVVGTIATVGLRRGRVPGLVAIVAMAVGLPLLVSWTLFGHTTASGLPTADTWHALTDALGVAREQYPLVVAPTIAIPGFQAVAAAALWFAVWFADWTAFRLRATVEALIPAAGIFAFCALMGSGLHEVSSTLAFAGAALAFVAAHRVSRRATSAASPRLAPRTLVAAGVLAVGALVAGAAVGPALPGADQEALVDWRNEDKDPSRLTISPMVELRKRLVDQRDTLAFTVRASAPSYWRLTALDQFDGSVWSSSGQFRDAGSTLDVEARVPSEGEVLEQEFEIAALAAIWAPAAYQPVALDDDDLDLRWDEESATLIVPSDRPTSDGTGYTVRSELPTLDPEQLRSADDPAPDDIAERYLPLPSSFPALAASLAQEVAGDEASTYDKAMALQQYFRTSFEYSLDVPEGHSDDALVDFLRSGEGYCEQFAGAFAAMARSIDVPARVAVGFTPGEEDADEAGTYRVTGRYAHAWPEVWFTGIGWVPFEPTPQRGLPGAETYTGVPEQQDDGEGGVVIATTTTSPTTTPPGSTPTPPTGPATTAPPQEQVGSGAAPRSDDDDRSGALPLLALGAALALAVAGVVLVRRRRTQVPPTAIDAAWGAVVARVRAATGTAPSITETYVEFARRAAPAVGDAARDLLALARLATEAQWSGQPLTDPSVRQAEALRDGVLAKVAPKRNRRDER